MCTDLAALRRHLVEITESSLTKQLRELEADGFLLDTTSTKSLRMSNIH